MTAFQRIQNRIDWLQKDLNDIRMNGMGPGNLVRKVNIIKENIQDAWEHDKINTMEYAELKNILNEVIGA